MRSTAPQRPAAAHPTRLGLVAIALWLSLGTLPSQAHDPGLSALKITLRPERILVALTFNRSDASALLGSIQSKAGPTSLTSPDAPAACGEAIARTLRLDLDGQAIEPAGPVVSNVRSNELALRLSFPRPTGGRCTLHSQALKWLPHGHRQFATVVDPRGRCIAQTMLDASNDQVSFDIVQTGSSPSRGGSFLHFLGLGVEHILTGYDHLLFLFGLLIASRGLRSALQTITAFTAAHSITLGLAALDVVRVPSSAVEPLIAFSVLVVGLENVLRRNLDRRWIMAFGFGLVHGLGFASVLRDLGLGGEGASLATLLVSFNLGVELGQVAIAALILPLVSWAQTRPAFQSRLLPAGSFTVAAAGACWLVARTFGG